MLIVECWVNPGAYSGSIPVDSIPETPEQHLPIRRGSVIAGVSHLGTGFIGPAAEPLPMMATTEISSLSNLGIRIPFTPLVASPFPTPQLTYHRPDLQTCPMETNVSEPA